MNAADRKPWWTMVMVAFIALLCATGCADVAHRVNVAPSAEHRMGDVVDGVDLLNELAGVDVYEVAAVDSEKRVDDEIVIRARDLNSKIDGQAQRTHRGVVIAIDEDCGDKCIAHELGHAAGLEHVADPDNLMHEKVNGDGLESWQIEVIRKIGAGYRDGL